MLNINGNRLTSIPDSIIIGTRSSFLLGIHAENNHFSQTGVARLTSLATGRSVVLNISIYDPVYDQIPQSPSPLNTTIDSITNKILLKAPEENRATLGSFLRSEEGVSSDFKRFLTECPRTQSYRTNPDQMIQSLYEITDKMRQSSDVKAKCETLATTAFGTCGDRVGLAFVQMQLSLNQSAGKVLEMNTEELFTYAKQESVVKFLSDKSQEKIDYIKTRGGVLDEIETHLAYLQAAPDLGVSLASGMLYRGCSNVTEQDLVMAKAEFNSEPIEQRVAKHLYEDGELRTAPFVQKIITEISDRTEFNTDAKTGESDGDYQERLKNLRAEFAKSATEEIAKELKESGLIERLREEIASAPPSVFVTGANILNAASPNNRSRNL